MEPAKPRVVCEPEHEAPRQRIDRIIWSFRRHPQLPRVRAIHYIAEESGIRISGPAHGLALQVQEVWSFFPKLIEAELWDDLLTQRIHDERVRAWAGSIIWWDRAERCKDPDQRAGWHSFADKYADHPYTSTVDEIIHLCAGILTDREVFRIRKLGGLHKEVFDCIHRRKQATHAVHRHENALLREAMKSINYVKSSNGSRPRK